MKTIFLLWLCIFFGLNSSAQVGGFLLSQKLSAHAAFSAHDSDVVSVLGNQASLLNLKGFYYGIFAEQKYFQKELNQTTLFVGKSLKDNNFSFIFDYVGFPEYYSFTASLGYGKSITEKTSIGIRFNFSDRFIKGCQHHHEYGGEIACCHQLTNSLKLGMVLANPQNVVQVSNSTDKEMVFFMKCGLLYDVSSQFYLYVDALKVQGFQTDIVAGLGYRFHKKLKANYSFTPQGNSSRVSLQFHFERFDLQLMGTFHPQLGFYPSTILMINPKIKS